MNIKVSNEYSVQRDFIHFINQVYNGVIPFDYELLSSSSNLNIPPHILKEKLALNQEYIDCVYGSNFQLDDTTKFLFESIAEIPVFIADLCDKPSTRMLESLNHLFSISFNTLDEIKTWVVSSSLSEGDKYKVMMLISEKEIVKEILDRYLDHSKTILDNLEDLYQKNFDQMVKEFRIDDFKRFVSEGSLNFKESDEIMIHLCPLNPIYIKVDSNNNSDSNTTVNIYLSPNTLDIHFSSIETSNFESQFIEVAKMLSEPKKLQILKLCLKEEKYGSELAKELNLSGATVSHHVNQLVNAGYLSINIDKNKVFYKTNAAVILKEIHYLDYIFE